MAPQTPLPTTATEMPPATATVSLSAASLPAIGPAPRWDNEVWINSEEPLPLGELRGKVVPLEFWTFG